jgi:hypothetical protein
MLSTRRELHEMSLVRSWKIPTTCAWVLDELPDLPPFGTINIGHGSFPLWHLKLPPTAPRHCLESLAKRPPDAVVSWTDVSKRY